MYIFVCNVINNSSLLHVKIFPNINQQALLLHKKNIQFLFHTCHVILEHVDVIN